MPVFMYNIHVDPLAQCRTQAFIDKGAQRFPSDKGHLYWNFTQAQQKHRAPQQLWVFSRPGNAPPKNALLLLPIFWESTPLCTFF